MNDKTSTAKTLVALQACGWDSLDPSDAADAEFIDRVSRAINTSDRNLVAHVIIGGGTLDEALEAADEILLAAE